MTMEEAQGEKNERLCQLLRLTPADHVLEIGTGWGGWALHAVRRHGCRVTTVTLSKQQFDYARARVAAAGLAGRIEVRLQDFREITGQYDKVVSIEMIEALGHRYLPDFCRVVNAALKKDGLLAMQFITCPDARYGEFRRGVDFIQKHIFPGSLLLSLNRVNACLSREAGMVVHGVDDMGPDYAVTLRRWAEAFNQQADAVRALGFDERFRRKWNYYLAYCEAAFALRNISVVQTVHSRPNNLSL
jgi:cyclopropane-fatty-acyl-phospholipid synthase